MFIGVDYYPEQWDRSLWAMDAEVMSKIGVSAVRLGEFAWSKLEPYDGRMDFSWLDEAIEQFTSRGIRIVMCIPTNCPPLWLYETHPEIIRIEPDGTRKQLGIRGHRCINSSVFMAYAKRVTEAIVRHYAHNENIIAWQIDNELEAYPCNCEECKYLFRNWLLERYESIENINTFYGNTVWSGQYSTMTQIQPPTAYPEAWQNPSLCLDFKRFTTDSAVRYLDILSSVIRKELPNAVITTNACISEHTPDFYKLYENLNFVAYDNYPTTRIPDKGDEIYSNAFMLDMMRGIKEQNFWVMEQLSGPTGSWAPMSRAPLPNMIKGYALQAIAHGADAVMHFRWRTALTGAEMFWHGILDHSNIPNRRFHEFSELCKTVAKLTALRNTQVLSDIAILYSPEDDWALKMQPQSEGYSYMEQLRAFHAAFTKYGANVDVISELSDLSDYKLVIAPSLYIANQTVVENIYRFIVKGGTIVFTNRSGVKDRYNNCIMDVLPTAFKELVGAEINEYDPLGRDEQTIVDFAGNEYVCTKWCDILKPTTAKTYAEYNDSYYRACPAITMNKYCSGVVYYVGTVCKMDFYEDFASNLMRQTGIPRLGGLPRGVEVTTRTNGRDDYIFFFNNSSEPATINLPKAMYSILDSQGKENLELKPFDMEILRK